MGFNYAVKLEIYSEKSGDTEEIIIPIELSFPTENNKYKALIVTTGTVNSNNFIDPRNKAILKVDLENRNILDHKNLDVEVVSDFFTGVQKIDLGPLKKDSLLFEFILFYS